MNRPLKLFLLAVVFLGLQFTWVLFFREISIRNLIYISAFNVILTLVMLLVMETFVKKLPQQAGFLFLALGLLKMFCAVLFLLPYIRPITPTSKPVVLHFMVSYLFFLVLETYYSYKRLNNN